jgi:hypothetical protein
MERYINWIIVSVISWVLFFVVLFTGIVKHTSVFEEHACQVQRFDVEPRFDCYTRCNVLNDDNNRDPSMPIDDYEIDWFDQDDEVAYSYLPVDDALQLLAEIQQSHISLNEAQIVSLLNMLELLKNPINDLKQETAIPNCDQLERDTLDWYHPKLCLHARWGFEDPLCPPENALCYVGDKWRRKCGLTCPLAYNITLTLNVDNIGTIVKTRDLGTNRDRYLSYKDAYTPNRDMTCQVIKSSDKVLFVDERMSHQAIQWWKWSLFSGTLLVAILTTATALTSLYRYKYRTDGHQYEPLLRSGSDQA